MKPQNANGGNWNAASTAPTDDGLIEPHPTNSAVNERCETCWTELICPHDEAAVRAALSAAPVCTNGWCAGHGARSTHPLPAAPFAAPAPAWPSADDEAAVEAPLIAAARQAHAFMHYGTWEECGAAICVERRAAAAELADLDEWLLHPDRSYTPHELAMETHRRLAALEAEAAP